MATASHNVHAIDIAIDIGAATVDAVKHQAAQGKFRLTAEARA